MTVGIEPIEEGDLARVARFLEREARPRRPFEFWAALASAPWPSPESDRGLMLVDGRKIRGVYLAYYSRREVGGKLEKFCNLGTWCVAPRHRNESLRLLLGLLAKRDYHFVDLSPNADVVKINKRLGFKSLRGTNGVLAAALPNGRFLRDPAVVSSPDEIEGILDGEQARIYADHRNAAGVQHLVLRDDAGECYVMLRCNRYRRVPLGVLLYAGDRHVLRRRWRNLTNYMALRRRVAAIRVAERVADRIPGPKRGYEGEHHLFRSPTLDDRAFDYIYSELTCAPGA